MTPRRNFFLHGELALVVLTLVEGRPMHGYELMAELDRLLRPAYQPSPGSVYPALAALVAEGLLSAEDEGRRRTYRITRRGRSVLAERRHVLRSFEVRTGVRLGADSARQALDRFNTRIAKVVERLDPDLLDVVLDRTAKELESAVLTQGRSSGD